MITPDGWFDWATRRAGPPDRPYAWRNSMSSLFLHSMEGVIGLYSALTDPNRYPTAWHGTVSRDGVLYQHYPVYAGLAHGGPNANPIGPGFESEGFAGEPLTRAQVQTWLRMIADMSSYTGRVFQRPAESGLVEHGEVAPTACPSGRYAPLYEAIEGGDMALIDEVIQALGGIEAIRQWNGPAGTPTGNSLLVGYGLEQQKLRQVEAQLRTHLTNHPGALSGVPEHTHQPGAVTREGQS